MEQGSKISALKQTLLSCKIMFRFALIFGAIINVLMLATPIYSMQVLDRVISSHNTNTLLMLSIIMLLAMALLGIIQACRSFAINKMGEWFEHKLAHKVFENSIYLSLQSKTNLGSQKIRDLQTVKTFLISPQLVAIIDTPWAIIFMIVLFVLHLWIGFLAMIGVILLIFMAILTDKLTKQLIEKNIELAIKSNRSVEQATRNAEVIEVMGLKDNIISSWQKLNQNVQDTQAIVRNRQIILEELTKFIRMVLQISVTGLGAYLVILGQITPGTIIASSALIGRALAPFDQFINAWKGFINFRKAYDRIEKGFEIKIETMNKTILPAPNGKISFENVFFSYPGINSHIIKNVSFTIEPGDVVAIIGHSASGKTTIAKLMVGAWNPTIGTVRIDGTSIKDWDRKQLGNYIGYLPQDVELFSGTVKENIGKMNRNAPDDDVIKASMIAGTHNIIIKFANGYNTEIGQDGSVLSGGQRQRIALARAFYGNPKIIVLDEPNASLDNTGEEALFEALKTAKTNGVTVIMISHRPQVLSIANKVLVMQDGMLIHYGNTQEIMSKLQQYKMQLSTNIEKKE